jgi:hypothetical protein
VRMRQGPLCCRPAGRDSRDVSRVDALYRQKHGLTVTGNYSLQDLVARNYQRL